MIKILALLVATASSEQVPTGSSCDPDTGNTCFPTDCCGDLTQPTALTDASNLLPKNVKRSNICYTRTSKLYLDKLPNTFVPDTDTTNAPSLNSNYQSPAADKTVEWVFACNSNNHGTSIAGLTAAMITGLLATSSIL